MNYLFYETPDWATKELLKVWKPYGNIFDPCVGGGAITNVLKEECSNKTWRILGTNDLDPERDSDYHLDATLSESWYEFTKCSEIDFVITNPPYDRYAPLIVENALLYSNYGTAMFLRNTFHEPCYNRKFLKDFPPNIVLNLPRYSFKKTEKSSTDCTSCSWFVWDRRLWDTQKILYRFQEEIEGFYKSSEAGLKMKMEAQLQAV